MEIVKQMTFINTLKNVSLYNIKQYQLHLAKVMYMSIQKFCHWGCL